MKKKIDCLLYIALLGPKVVPLRGTLLYFTIYCYIHRKSLLILITINYYLKIVFTYFLRYFLLNLTTFLNLELMPLHVITLGHSNEIDRNNQMITLSNEKSYREMGLAKTGGYFRQTQTRNPSETRIHKIVLNSTYYKLDLKQTRHTF